MTPASRSERRYTFGPVPSRRLGLSLGVDVVPYKLCTLDCLYCELGPTTDPGVTRGEHAPPDQVLAELRQVLEHGPTPEWITFSGSGEPTLHLRLGEMITAVKADTAIPVAVLTNGTLLWDPVVQRDLSLTDLVVPSLDAGSEETFRRVNRPTMPGLTLEILVSGIAAFTEGFPGQVWLEVLLLDGSGSEPRELELLAGHIRRIRPHRVQLGTLARPPAHAAARPMEAEQLEEVQRQLQEQVGEIPVEGMLPPRHQAPDAAAGTPAAASAAESVLAYLRRRPGTVEDLATSLGQSVPEIEEILHRPSLDRRLRRRTTGGQVYLELEDREQG